MIKKFSDYITESVSETETRECIKELLKDSHKNMLSEISDRFIITAHRISESEKSAFDKLYDSLSELYISLIKDRSDEEFL